MISQFGDSLVPDSTPRSASLASSPLSPNFPVSPNSFASAPSGSSTTTSTPADTSGIVQGSRSVAQEPATASRDTQALGTHEESFRALSISKPQESLSPLPPLASFFDTGISEHLSGLEEEDGSGDGDKKFQEENSNLGDVESSGPSRDSPHEASDPPLTKPILNPSAVPFFSVNSGLGALQIPSQDPAQEPVTIHTHSPRVPPQQPVTPSLQMQLQAQLPLANQQQLLQLLVQNQLLLQQQALLQPSLSLSLPTQLSTPMAARSPNSHDLTFPPRSPVAVADQPELTPHSAELKLQKQREALARGMSTLSKPDMPRARSFGQDPSSSSQQEVPFSSPGASLEIPQKDFLRYLPSASSKAHSSLDTPSHFSVSPVAQTPSNADEPPQARQNVSPEDRQVFLQFQQWQKQQKLQGYDSSDMLRWVNDGGGPAASPNNDLSPRPRPDANEQWQKPTDLRFPPKSNTAHGSQVQHSDYEQARHSPRPLMEERTTDSVSPANVPRHSVSKDREEPWKPQLTIDPPESWQKPQLTIDPPDRVVGELSIPIVSMSRSRSREEQWQQRKQTLEPERGSLSPAHSPSRPDWVGLKQRSSFDSAELHPRTREEWHRHDSLDNTPPIGLNRARTTEPWSPHRDYLKPRQSFDSTLDVPQAPMSVGRSRSTPTGLSSKKIGSRFNFIPTEAEENDDAPSSPFPSATTPTPGSLDPSFQPPTLSTLINQELLRQGLLVQLSNLQAQQARQAMQAALAQPADEATINAAVAASNAASQLATQQQLQYYQAMSLRGQFDPNATSIPPDFAGSLSPLPSSPGGQDDLSKSPRRSFSSVDKTGKVRSQERSRSSQSLGRRDANSPPSPSPSPTNAASVPWLEAFRAAKGMDQLSLKEVVVRGWLKDLATDQYGSRFLQRRLEAASQEHKHLAFDQLMQTGILPLCTDVFGNYVVQKFFDYSGPEHRVTLATKLLGNVLQLSMQMYGCRVVQKAIELSEPPVQTQLVRELDGHVIECAEDQNGNHVIQKCLEKVAANKLDFMVDAFKGQIARLATHPYGCRVIQRLLERWGSEESIVSELLGEHTDELCRNQYGNYVIQHLLIHGSPWQRSGIIHALLGKLFVLSKHKFASNVVENCFVYGSPQDRTALIQEVLGRHPDESCLLSMVRDQYANYVVQKMIDLCDPEQLAMIVQRIKRHVPGLRKIPYGKNILTRLEKLTGTVFSGTTQLGSDAFPNNEISSAATIPFPGTDNVSPLHMGHSWPSVVGHSPMNRRPDTSSRFPRGMGNLGRDDSRDRGCPVFSGHRPLSIETDTGFAIDDQFDSYYANLQSTPDGGTEYDEM